MAPVPSSPLPQEGILTLYSLSYLILTFHLLVRQITTWVHVLSAVFPHLLLVAVIETVLFRSLFPLMQSGCLLVHSMRKWQLFLEPALHCTLVHVLLYSPFCLGALSGLFLTTCRSSLLGLGMSRTGSSSATFLGYLDSNCMSLATSLLDEGLGP